MSESAPESRVRKVYTYAVVTNNGAGVHSTHRKLSRARDAAERLAAERFAWGHIEIERIEHITRVPGAWPRRYQMRQGKRWVEARHDRDALSRRPDMFWDRSTTEAALQRPTPESSSRLSAGQQEAT